MNYIVFDLEFNQKHKNKDSNEDKPSPSIMFEIIQIGALKLDDNLDTISTFNSFIKPTVHTVLHPYIAELTSITEEQINSSKNFLEVYEDFSNFIGKDKTVFVLWGVNDLKELIKNATYYKLNVENIPKAYIDIQLYTSKLLNCPKGLKIGLKNALEVFNLPMDSSFHDAFNDAYYTAEIFKKVYNTDIQPLLYVHEPDRVKKAPKIKVNISALISQFEKMYNRQLTFEEKSMIKTAYMMGKTNQFTE